MKRSSFILLTPNVHRQMDPTAKKTVLSKKLNASEVQSIVLFFTDDESETKDKDGQVILLIEETSI